MPQTPEIPAEHLENRVETQNDTSRALEKLSQEISTAQGVAKGQADDPLQALALRTVRSINLAQLRNQ